MKKLTYVPLLILLTTFTAYGAIEWGNLIVKGNLSVTGTSTLTGTTTIGGVTALSQTNTVSGITNKTFTAPTLDIGVFDDQSSTPSNPSSGFYKFYFKTDGKAYTLDSSGTETQLGSGASGTNDQSEYITNGKFEDAVTGWAAYADAASSSPADGTGGTPSVTFSRTTTAGEILKGNASGELVKGAVNEQGEGFSYDFTVDYENYTTLRPVYISFDYKTTANYASSDIKVFVYDKDAAALLTVQDADNLSGALPAATTSRRFTGVFYPTTTTSNDYRIIFHITSTNASAYDVHVDSVHAGSTPFIPGAIVTDWTSFTPTCTWVSNTTCSGRWRRVGDSMEIWYRALTSGAPTAATLTFNIPSGYSVNTSKLVTTAASASSWGWGLALDSGISSYEVTPRYDGSTDQFSMVVQVASGTYVQNSALVNATTPFTFGANDEVTAFVRVPITNWTSGASVSTTEMLQSTVKFQGSGDPASASSGNPIIFPSETYDTHSAHSTSTGLFTVPKTGWYRVHGYANSANAAVAIAIYNNSSPYATIGSTDSNGEAAFSGTVYAAKDSTISIRPNGTLDLTGSSVLNIEQIPDFSIFSQYNVADRQYTCTLSGPAGWSTTYCFLIPYLTADGTWRARFNFQGTYTSAASLTTLAMTGVTFHANRQAISCNDNSFGSAPFNNFVAGSNFNIDFASNNTDATCSGDVALASKPTMVP